MRCNIEIFDASPAGLGQPPVAKGSVEIGSAAVDHAPEIPATYVGAPLRARLTLSGVATDAKYAIVGPDGGWSGVKSLTGGHPATTAMRGGDRMRLAPLGIKL